MSKQQLWLELPPISVTAPRRLLVCFHGEGSSPEEFAPVAISWQLKFPGATVLVMQGLAGGVDGRWHWFDPRAQEGAPRQLGQAGDLAMARIANVQQQQHFRPEETVLMGFSQGGNLVLEAACSHGELFSIAVAYCSRLTRRFKPGETVRPEIHLINGNRDALNPPVYGRQLFDALNAAGASATLDLVEEGGHSINQDMIIAGTTRTLQTVFRRRKQARLKTLN